MRVRLQRATQSASPHRASISIATAIPQESTQRPYPQPPPPTAAASLVAGGLALLESIFPTAKTSALIDRLLKTASKNYDLNKDGINDYRAFKHGQGLMDLACAIKPGLSATLSRTGCVDRFPTVFVSSDDIIEAFRGAGNGAEDSALIDSSTFTDRSSTADKRQREYANQPGLDKVGAAFAYGKAGAGAVGIDAAIAKAGADSNISVVTNRRFDPTHPEFSSSANNAKFDTLTRFYVWSRDVATPPTTLAAVIPAVFGTDEAKARVQLYSHGFGSSGAALATIRVPNLGSVTFESISRDAFEASGNGAVRTALETFLKRVVDGTQVDKSGSHKLTKSGSWYYFSFNGNRAGHIELTRSFDGLNFNHVGRVYTDGGNIGSYQIFIDSNYGVRDDSDYGECVGNNACYGDDVPAVASGAEMGILALINGLANPSATGVAYNTHGIAPGATLNVFTSRAAGLRRGNIVDTIYRARGIDVARDVSSGNIIADKDRNIVIINNNMAASTATGAVTQVSVNTITTTGGAYKTMYETLQVGLNNTNKQDAYVFAARDGGAADIGLLAALPISTHGTSISDYSIIVVAAEDGQTPCGGDPRVRTICIAAPGEYQYRDRHSTTGVYAKTLSTATSANAAASLVAGGLALLESIFSTETTARLIDRLLKTASRNYDLNNDDTNDYTLAKHGQGLMDLACAIKPGLSVALSRVGCIDRHAPAGMSAPQQPQPDETTTSPAGYAEGEPAGEDVNTNKDDTSIDYCNIDGLRIILSGDLCSDDYVTLVDKDGNLNPETVGNLRFGMGFGDSLLQGLGITFFDAFDTAWTVDNPYNPYAHLLNFGNIVIAPAETRFDVEDRFAAMRYGTRPGQRKTWRSDTAAIVMDFATQGMATKPYAVTRGQIRNTLTHDNMGADPYSEVRFMLSAEDNVGVGRLKVMTYSGMAMGYALGLHSQGDDMMPSYLLTNRDSFHAPYLSLASSGLGGGMTYRFNDGGHIGFVMGEGTSLNADGTLPYQQQTERPRAFAGMMEYAPHKNLMFQMGALQEESTLLASQGSGLFDIDGGATAFVGVQAKQPLSDNWQALFSGYGGRTQLGGSSGIVSGLDVLTTSFDVGLLGSHILEKGDHLLFRAGQPMRVESGSLDLSYVSHRNGDRGVVSGTQSFDVAPSMRSVEFGVGYGVPIGQKQGHIRFAVDYVMNPGHRRIRDEVFGIMSFSRQF